MLFLAHYFSRISPCYYYSLFFNDKRQTCLRDGKTLKVVLCTKFCPACDKQVIARALVQLRINFTCIFKVSKLPSSLRNSGNYVKTLKILVKLILNCPRAHAITYTNKQLVQYVSSCLEMRDNLLSKALIFSFDLLFVIVKMLLQCCNSLLRPCK